MIKKFLVSLRRKIEYFILKVIYKLVSLSNINTTLKEVTFFPQKPHDSYVIWKIVNILGMSLKSYNPFRNPKIIVAFEDTTDPMIVVKDYVAKAHKKKFNGFIINSQCLDISKKKVGEVFFEVFGYNLDLDPTTFEGYAVKKSNENAAHDGSIVKCPIKKEEVDDSYVYSVLVNNTISGNMVEDIRTPIIFDEIPFVYKKHRNIDTRFSNTNKKTFIENTLSNFTYEEIEKISSFCHKIGLEIGEIDVLRDKDNGKIYIVDVNKTPAGPPNNISKLSYYKALLRLAKAFEQGIIKKLEIQ